MQHLASVDEACSRSHHHQERLLRRAAGQQTAFTRYSLWRTGWLGGGSRPHFQERAWGLGMLCLGPTGHSGADPERERVTHASRPTPNPGSWQAGTFSVPEAESLTIVSFSFLRCDSCFEFSGECPCFSSARGSKWCHSTTRPLYLGGACWLPPARELSGGGLCHCPARALTCQSEALLRSVVISAVAVNATDEGAPRP